MEPKADSSILQYTNSVGEEYIFENSNIEVDHSDGWAYYRPEPGTMYRVYRNVDGDVFLKLAEFQHERIITDLCSLPRTDVLAKYHLIERSI